VRDTEVEQREQERPDEGPWDDRRLNLAGRDGCVERVPELLLVKGAEVDVFLVGSEPEAGSARIGHPPPETFKLSKKGRNDAIEAGSVDVTFERHKEAENTKIFFSDDHSLSWRTSNNKTEFTERSLTV
jgi:hypothetical protein